MKDLDMKIKDQGFELTKWKNFENLSCCKNECYSCLCRKRKLQQSMAYIKNYNDYDFHDLEKTRKNYKFIEKRKKIKEEFSIKHLL